MVWGCFSSSGVGNLTIVSGRINAASYIEILDVHLIESVAKLRGVNHVIFQQDNVTSHTAVATQEYLHSQGIAVMS